MNLITAVLASALACQSVNDERLVGLWESEKTSDGGIGNNIEFRRDGSFIAAVIVLADMYYKVQDGKLYLGMNKEDPMSLNAGPEISIENEFLIFSWHDGNKEVRRRMLPKDDDSVIGAYKYRHYSNGVAYERFTSDGTFNFRLPMRSSRGCYRQNNSEIELNMPGEKINTIQYSFSGDKLVLGGQDEKAAYNRVAGGAWYDSEHIDYE